MKKFFKHIFQIKLSAGLCFIAIVVFYSAVSLFYGQEYLSIYTLIAFAAISLISSAFQYLIFSDVIIKKMRYWLRMIILIISLCAIFICCVIINQWITLEIVGSWTLFVGVFLVAFIGITIGYEVYFKITGIRYDEILSEYKAKHNSN